MNHCKRCRIPIPDGFDYCFPKQSFERVPKHPDMPIAFDGCASLRDPAEKLGHGKGQTTKWSRSVGSEPAERYEDSDTGAPCEPYSAVYGGELSNWLFEGLHCYSLPKHTKYLACSEWTNEHYGCGWLRFARVLRRVAQERHIALVGFHVASIALTDVVESVLLDELQVAA